MGMEGVTRGRASMRRELRCDFGILGWDGMDDTRLRTGYGLWVGGVLCL